MKSRIIKGSLILLIGFGLFNFLNFLYQSAMASLLSVTDYGILAALGAIIYIFTIFSESIQTVVAKYAVSNSNDEGRIKNLIKRSMRKSRYFATLSFGLYLIISIVLSIVLSIPYFLLALTGLLIYVVFLLPITRGAMQGLQQFTALSTSLVLESLFKLILGIVFVLLGWRVYGAIGGFLIGALFAFVISFMPLRKILKSNEKPFNAINIYSYAKPTTFITAIIVLFSSIDVLVVQILFNPETAGAYSIASILGKIVMWVSVPIGKAMFPLSAESQEQPLRNKKIFKTALIIICLLISGAVGFFALFSNATIYIFSHKVLPEAVAILPYLAIAFGFVALANVILLYKLSIGRVRGYSWLIIYNIIEILLFFIAPRTMISFVLAFVLSSAILFIGSIFAMNDKKLVRYIDSP